MIILGIICAIIISSKTRTKEEIYLEDLEQLRAIRTEDVV